MVNIQPTATQPTTSSFSSSSDDYESANSDTDSPSSSLPLRSPLSGSHSADHNNVGGGEQDEEEDDIPLARRIPTALAAQRSIRQQQKEASIRKQQPKDRRAHPPITKHKLFTKLTAPSPNVQSGLSADDLSQRLLQLNPLILSHREQNSRPSQNKSATDLDVSIDGSAMLQKRERSALVSREESLVEQKPIAASVFKGHQSTNSITRAASTRMGQTSTRVDTSVRRANTTATPRSTPQRAKTHTLESIATSGLDKDAVVHQQSSTVLSRSAGTTEGGPSKLPTGNPKPLMVTQPNKPDAAMIRSVQQKVFLVNSEKCDLVQIQPSTQASDVVASLSKMCEPLDIHKLPGEWMLWELASDHGMERPVRPFERPSDIMASWNTDKCLNAFVVKKTTLAGFLKKEVIPETPPGHKGFIEWESRRGKWNKRWMELRESVIYLSKKEHSKEETCICSLSNFDAYMVSSKYRSPKPFVFALKSTDNPTLFENQADYLHMFSCESQSGQVWMQKIIMARSYVLQQERTVLFQGKPKSVNPNSASHGRRLPPGPLISVAPSAGSAKQNTAPNNTNLFEPGSLLAKHNS